MGDSRLSATFYFDLGSPYAYLTAERISGVFAERGLEQPEWQPILLGGLFKRFDRGSWAMTTQRRAGIVEVESRAASYGLPPLRWPDPFPGNMLTAMRAAIYAKQTGRTVAFSLAAFRQAFAAGRDLSDPDSVVIAAAACEMHPAAVLKAAGTRGVTEALARATAEAAEAGVRGVPAVRVGDRVFHGEAALEGAADALRGMRAA
jgi:2-hydroxychromene-2-carboxylate isomerase